MDSSHVALVSLMLNVEGFDHYKLQKPFTMGISILNLSKVLKLASQDDSITLKADENPTCLTIIFSNDNSQKRTEFSLNLLQLDSEHLGIPDTQYTSEISMNSGEFCKLCKELYQISETVTITTSEQFVQFDVEGEVGKGSVKINTSTGEKDEDGEVSRDKQLVNLSFALRYLNMFTKASSLSNEVKLQMAPETPIVVEYQISGLGGLYYYLAPKINDDNN